MNMSTVGRSRVPKVGYLILLSSAFVVASQAQLTAPQGNLTFQVIGDSATQTAGSVTGWNDVAPDANNSSLLAPDVGAQPTFTASAINGHAAVHFDGAADILANANVNVLDLVSATESATFLVLRPQPGTAGADHIPLGWMDYAPPVGPTQDHRLLVWSDLGANPGKLSYEHGDALANSGNGHFVTVSQPGSWYDNNFHILRMVRQSDGTGTIAVDGVVQGTGTFLNALSSSTGSLAVGGATASFGRSFFFAGDIAEALVYNSGGVNVNDVETYLTDKYFTPVPEPSQYAAIFGGACLLVALGFRARRQQAA